MIGITIGIGHGWQECARKACFRMHEMTGLRCLSIEATLDAAHPSWMKHQILRITEFHRETDFLYFDADIFPMKPWNPERIFTENGRRFCCVMDNDPGMASQVRHEEGAIGIPIGSYINAGLFMFGREHAPIFDEVWSMRPSFHRWIDQSALNFVLHKQKVNVAILPNEYNQLRPDGRIRGTNDINSHLCGLGGNWHMLWRMQEMIFNQGAACNPPPTSASPTTTSPKATDRRLEASIPPPHQPGQAS